MQHAYTTALVTGASSGIGRHLAMQLAADGCDLVVPARRTSLLEELAADLRAEHQVSVEVLTAGLTSPEGVAAAAGRLTQQAPPVELLVNNAGFGSSRSFADLPAGSVTGQVSLNVPRSRRQRPRRQRRRHTGICVAGRQQSGPCRARRGSVRTGDLRAGGAVQVARAAGEDSPASCYPFCNEGDAPAVTAAALLSAAGRPLSIRRL